jgi:hypothetical protein
MDFMAKRPIEEFYDLTKDPGCWNNLINNKDYKEQINKFRQYLKNEMLSTNDPERYYYHINIDGSINYHINEKKKIHQFINCRNRCFDDWIHDKPG